MIGQLSKEEINRKLLHLLAIILPFGIFYLPIVWKIHPIGVCCLIFFLLFISLLIEYFRLRETLFGSWFSDSFGSMMRTEEKKTVNWGNLCVGWIFNL
jgi:dolichol kinase